MSYRPPLCLPTTWPRDMRGLEAREAARARDRHTPAGTPRLNAACRQRALLCGIGRATSEAPEGRREIVTSR